MTSPVTWPPALIDEIAARRCVVVLGAGASASSTNKQGKHPPSWAGLLEGALPLVPDEEDRAAAQQLMERGAYLDSAQVIWSAAPKAAFASFLGDMFAPGEYAPSAVHQVVARLDPKVVVTTNYDTIYETQAAATYGADAVVVRKFYEPDLVDDLRGGARVVAKVHGCVTAPERIILTRRQYFDARRKHSDYYAGLDALVLSSTLLFVGSGFGNDPDIDLLLQNANITAPSKKRHYALVPGGWPDAVRDALSHSYNVDFVEYEAGHHEQVPEALAALADAVEERRT